MCNLKWFLVSVAENPNITSQVLPELGIFNQKLIDNAASISGISLLSPQGFLLPFNIKSLVAAFTLDVNVEACIALLFKVATLEASTIFKFLPFIKSSPPFVVLF